MELVPLDSSWIWTGCMCQETVGIWNSVRASSVLFQPSQFWYHILGELVSFISKHSNSIFLLADLIELVFKHTDTLLSVGSSWAMERNTCLRVLKSITWNSAHRVQSSWANVSPSGIFISSCLWPGSYGKALDLYNTIWHYLHAPQFRVSSTSRHPLGLFSHQTTPRNTATTWTVSGWSYLSPEAGFTSSSMILTWSLSLTSWL